MKHLTWLTLLFGALLALIGCGGSDATSSTGGAGGRSNIFLTDTFRDDYEKVWFTIYGVNAVMDTGTVSVFSDDSGEVVDVRSLRDNAGQRFWFLGGNQLPAGNVTALQLVVNEKVTITPTGGSSNTEVTLDSSLPRNGSGQVIVTINLPAPRPSGNGQPFVIDFDLANFSVNGNVLTPSFTIGSNTGLYNLERQERRPLEGTVANLSGAVPGQTFLLQIGQGRSVSVATDSTTSIFREDNQSASLANGARVRVIGKFDVETNTFLASQIRVRGGQGNNDDIEAHGAASNINAGARSFDVRVQLATGFVPSEPTIQVVATSNAIFRSKTGRVITDTEFFTQLAQFPEVEVEGTYNANTNVFTAKKLKLEDGDDNGGGGNDAEVNGTPTSVNATARTLSVYPITEIFGFSWGDEPLPVVVTPQTTYRDDNGETISAEAFWSAVASSPFVEVEGHFRAGVLTATKMKLDSD